MSGGDDDDGTMLSPGAKNAIYWSMFVAMALAFSIDRWTGFAVALVVSCVWGFIQDW